MLKTEFNDDEHIMHILSVNNFESVKNCSAKIWTNFDN